jgi:hypothetical protein
MNEMHELQVAEIKATALMDAAIALMEQARDLLPLTETCYDTERDTLDEAIDSVRSIRLQ